ncbi:MAG: hypothetical protein V3R86_07860, partial [Candidatus Hydrothermarchaeaceae archaeon]
SNPESSIYYKNIPKTCGNCHADVYDEFKKSAMYHNLESDKLAPTCATCMGTHDIAVVDAIKISKKCENCHNVEDGIKPHIPNEAKGALLLQEKIKGEILESQSTINIAKEKGKDVKRAEEALQEATSRLEKSGSEWHRFRISEFEGEMLDASYYANKANNIAYESLIEPQVATKKLEPRFVLILAIVQLFMVILLMSHNYREYKLDNQKKILFISFLMYFLYLAFFIFNTSIESITQKPHSELASIFSHMFKNLFYILFGFSILMALITDSMLNRILKTSVYLGAIMVILGHLGVIIVEGNNLKFHETVKELAFESINIAFQILVINVIYHSWRATKSKNLLLYGGAFILFLASDLLHFHNLMWGYLWLRHLMINVFSTLGLLALAYSTRTKV